MANMSYCRFENTSRDLQDCVDNFDDNLEGAEFLARKRIVKLAKEIVDNWGEEEFEEKMEEEEN